jgi:8-oxo-dGTP diphosphatase/2-hydroxy-dATP diphosphatase
MQKKIMTLCCLYDDTRILLGMKKRGFGAGKWNGFGGKINAGETIEQAAKRELKEEAGLSVEKIDKRGVILFEFENNPEKLEVHIFSAHIFSGEPKESEEMRPQWFALDKIPYQDMWPDDIFWMPLMLSGKNFAGTVHFKDTNEIIEYELKEIV